jgi:DNA-binding IscR family transcriptional regulator
MKMPEKVRLAVDLIRFMKELPDGSPRRVEDLAQSIGTTKNFLHQVVCHLSKAGLVNVVKGPKGGVTVGFTEGSLFDIYQLFGYMSDEINKKTASPAQLIEQEMREFLQNYII